MDQLPFPSTVYESAPTSIPTLAVLCWDTTKSHRYENYFKLVNLGSKLGPPHLWIMYWAHRIIPLVPRNQQVLGLRREYGRYRDSTCLICDQPVFDSLAPYILSLSNRAQHWCSPQYHRGDPGYLWYWKVPAILNPWVPALNGPLAKADNSWKGPSTDLQRQTPPTLRKNPITPY